MLDIKLPPRVMCYDGYDADDGPALDVEDVKEWAIALIDAAAKMQDSEANLFFRDNLHYFVKHCS